MNPPRSHYLPRTRNGWIATILFVSIMILAQPPIVHGFMNRVDPWVLGMPFLYAWLLGVYIALIAVLIWAYRKRI